MPDQDANPLIEARETGRLEAFSDGSLRLPSRFWCSNSKCRTWRPLGLRLPFWGERCCSSGPATLGW
jgi:hypothetical protein